MLPAAPYRAAGAYDQLARLDEDALRDAAHDTFMALWRGAEGERAMLWAAYCEAQERYDAYLLGRSAS
jgi:hypothetical protein